MADTTSYKLVVTCATANGEQFSISYYHFNGESTDAQVKTFTDAIVTNGSVFKKVPVTCISAKKMTTIGHEYDIS